uniref:Transmembrane protein 60 n=1 Tax=Octopus bimaculoides TaxID=37653 RepID=A0A0L8HMB5_OCTBM|eukprot:XP_014771201.1 PREDICTED: transmembrane protein 60-like [Octopus bimaculoides]
MALLHKALFTWFIVLVFLVLLVLRLDERVNWNWFLIFIPLWVFDGVCIIYITISMIMQCKNNFDLSESNMTMKRKLWFIVSALLKIVFQVLICLKLQNYPAMTLYFVLIPFWLLLSGVIGDITYGMFTI